MSLGTPEIDLKIVDLDTTLNSMRCRNHYWPLRGAQEDEFVLTTLTSLVNPMIS